MKVEKGYAQGGCNDCREPAEYKITFEAWGGGEIVIKLCRRCMIVMFRKTMELEL